MGEFCNHSCSYEHSNEATQFIWGYCDDFEVEIAIDDQSASYINADVALFLDPEWFYYDYDDKITLFMEIIDENNEIITFYHDFEVLEIGEIGYNFCLGREFLNAEGVSRFSENRKEDENDEIRKPSITKRISMLQVTNKENNENSSKVLKQD